MIDLRSDTVTRPSIGMREAMMCAEVGDDVFGEDPTVNQLQTYAAALFGKEAALFCASGTQTNQIAINVHVQPGGEVICHEEAHIYKYEGGGIAKNSGASVRLLQGDRGRLTPESIELNIQPNDIHFPITQLIALEDTANRGGGAVYEFETIQAIAQLAKNNGIPLHLDGARLFNALAVSGIDPVIYGAQFDSISICLSKGLGAPVGSLLLGTESFIAKARRVRKVMGGGMRQAGFLAAAGLYALEHNVDRLKMDHERAKIIEGILNQRSWVKQCLPVETNILVIVLKDAQQRDLYIEKMLAKGIKTVAFGPGMIRMVFHLDISEEQQQYLIKHLPTID
jgi:threonine aldolase